MQIADGGIGGEHLAAQHLERFLQSPAPEVVPERRHPAELALGGIQERALLVSGGRRGPQPLVHFRQPCGLDRQHVRLVLPDLAHLLLAREFGGEAGELLMAALPQGAQLEENQRPEPALRVAEQLAEGVELFLDADGRALLLFQAVVQEVEFVLQIGIGLFQARPVLEELHEPLFFRHSRPRRRP